MPCVWSVCLSLHQVPPAGWQHCQPSVPWNLTECWPMPPACAHHSLSRAWLSASHPSVELSWQVPTKAAGLHRKWGCATTMGPAGISLAHPVPTYCCPELQPLGGHAATVRDPAPGQCCRPGCILGKVGCSGLSQAGNQEGLTGVVRGRAKRGQEAQGAAGPGPQTPRCLSCLSGAKCSLHPAGACLEAGEAASEKWGCEPYRADGG